jgi:SAM-dependent methyltransferase
MSTIENLTSELRKSLENQSFVKMSLGNYRGKEDGLKAVYAKIALIKKAPKISFTYRYKTKDIVKNYSFEEVAGIVENLVVVDGFRAITLLTLNFDLFLEINKNGVYKYHKKPASCNSLPSSAHDKQKNRKIEAIGKQYLQELKITDKEGNVYASAQDKFKQINHYIEILSSLLADLPKKEIINVVDMGSGKGYLTFALYDYLTNTLKRSTKITGVEYRKDLVDLCNDVASKANFENLNFVQGSIESYENPHIDVLIALHACDTATDDAISQGIKSNADLIVVAPCCHKQIRREVERNQTKNSLEFLMRFGIFLERQSEMVTDGIRALILEYFGYDVKVVEFISDAHTPKNVLIVGARKKTLTDDEKEEILNRINATKEFFGVGYHHLEKNLDLLQN